MSGALVRYDAMCTAIAAAYKVDEVKDIRDKARAIEVYSRQAKNTEAERQACEIRLRAERKCGALLKAREKAKGSPGNQHTGPVTPSDRSTETLGDLGISKQQSSNWQKLAEVPDEQFELAVKTTDKPTTIGIISQHAPKPEPKKDQVDPKALWLWGRLQDFEREGLLDADPATITKTMLPHMKRTTDAMVPRVIAWLKGIA